MKPGVQFNMRQLLWVTVLAAVWCMLLTPPGLAAAMRSWVFPGALRAGLVLGLPIAIVGVLIGNSFRGTIVGCGVAAFWTILSTPC